MINIICAFLSLVLFTTCRSSDMKISIIVFSAASTGDLISEIAVLFEKETGIQVKINRASSGILAKQLNDGARADVYISASKKWVDFIDSEGLVEEEHPFMRNRLVLISHIDSSLEAFKINKYSNLPEVFSGYISLGDPDHVPAGQYAAEALSSFSWYEALADRFLPASDVRSALSVVEFDEAEVGIVYSTDAQKSQKVKVISFFPEDSHSPVLYFCALLKNYSPQGRIFYNFLINNDEVKDLYRHYGFNSSKLQVDFS